MALLIDRVRTLAQSIGADVKSIMAKTNLLKSAAYRDVGTAAGNVAEFVGDKGVGGFGFGGRAIKLPDNQDMNALPKITAVWTGEKKSSTTYVNMPEELNDYIYNYRFLVETSISADGYCVSQVLTLTAYMPSGLASINTVVYIRTLSITKWSDWQRVTGKMIGIDVGGDVIGDDIEANSITAGIGSPKIGFELISKPVNYENFGYQADGITQLGQNDVRGLMVINPSQPTSKVLSISIRVIHRSPYNADRAVSPEYEHSGEYYEILQSNSDVNRKTMKIRTLNHVQVADGKAAKSGQNIFDGQGHVDMFVTYKVD